MKLNKLIAKLKGKNKCPGTARSAWKKENSDEGHVSHRSTEPHHEDRALSSWCAHLAWGADPPRGRAEG